jgi:hypothetical protein
MFIYERLIFLFKEIGLTSPQKMVKVTKTTETTPRFLGPAGSSSIVTFPIGNAFNVKPNRSNPTVQTQPYPFKSFPRVNLDTMLQHQGITSNKRPLDITDAPAKTERHIKQAKISTFFAPAANLTSTNTSTDANPAVDDHDDDSRREQVERTSHLFTGKPQVSSLGRFKSSTGVISTPKPTKSGYVSVYCNGKSHQIHRLMAIAFALPKRDDQDTVDHIDNDPSNNRLENLRWANRSEQTQHSYATNETRASSAPRTSKPVEGRELGAEVWVPYASSSEAARSLGLNPGDINACCRGRQKKTGGYEFRWGEANEVAVLEGETWKPYESAWVSSLGRYKSSKGVVSTPKPKQSGYVSVFCNGKCHQIHRLMAIAFALPKRDDQDTVDHIDSDPSNNRLENLRWANQSEQVKHSYATNETRASNAPKRSKPVEGRVLGAEAWVPYASSMEAARSLGLRSGNISACCSGKQKQTGGYEFRWGVANEVAVLEGETWKDVIICA